MREGIIKILYMTPCRIYTGNPAGSGKSMNTVITRSLSLDSKEHVSLLISISDRAERCNNPRQFIDMVRREITRAGLPVFSLTLVTGEKDGHFCITVADLCQLDSPAADGSEHAEVNIVIKTRLEDEKQVAKSPLIPCLDGKIVRTAGVLLDENIPCREVEWNQFMEYYSSQSPLVSRVWSKNDSSREIVVLPLRSGERIVGALQFMSPGLCSLTGEAYRGMVLLCRVIGSAFTSCVSRGRAAASESKYRMILEAVPLAILVLDRDFNVIEENGRFRKWFEERKTVSTGPVVLDDEDTETPFSRVYAAETFSGGKGIVRDIICTGKVKEEVFRIRTSPIMSETGEVTGVMEIIEDITLEAQKGRRVMERKDELEFEVARKIEALQEKERNLTVLVNTVRGLETDGEKTDSIERIARGYEELSARSIFVALYDHGFLSVETVFPRTMSRWLGDALGFDPCGFRISLEENPDDPFLACLSMNNPVFYMGEEGVKDFCRVFFRKTAEEKLRAAHRILKGLSIVVFPLVTKHGMEGIIAVAAEKERIEDTFEYYLLLSNSAAVEMSRIRNAEHLSCSERKYRNLVESSRDMITLCDRDGKIHYSNGAFFEKTGLVESDLSRVRIYDLFPGMGRSRLESVVKGCFENGDEIGTAEFMMRTPIGADIWTELSINNVSNGVPACQIVLRDITSRKNMEVEIGSLTAFQEKILQNEFIGIITMTPAGNITNWNRGAANILGYAEKEVQNRFFFDLVVSEEQTVNVQRDPGEGRKSGQIELRKKDGDGIHVMYFESVMRDARNRPAVIIAFFFDVTEKVNLERESKELMIQLTQAQNVTILSLARLTEYRDIETGFHLERIMRYTELLSNELSSYKQYRNYISREYIQDLVNSCPLHDIGKVGIPDNILHKPGRLTVDEFEIMKNHTLIGGDTIQQAEEKLRGRSYLMLGKEVAYYHHERWDGTGYPRGLKGDDIPLSARIVAVADVYDALTSRRPYKDAFTHDVASEIIRSSAKTHFDDSVVKAFRNCEDEFRKFITQVH